MQIQSIEVKIQDFISLYNCLWYRDFPVLLGGIEFGKRADWTTHIATTIRQLGSYMGMFSCFESGSRTDAELKLANGDVWAKLEWEWDEPRNESVNELRKLAGAANETTAKHDLSIFIGYSQVEKLDENLDAIKIVWEDVGKPLVVLLVTFTLKGSWRYFAQLKTYKFDNYQELVLIREQPALPWNVPNSRWQKTG